MPGLRTLTITSRPLLRRALWICAMDAVASGSGSSEDVIRHVLGDHPFDLFERHGRSLVDELSELVDVDVRQKIRTRGQQLSELDVRRAELLERLAELARAFPRRRPAAPDPELAEHAQQPTRRATRPT
jgi:hypothetical protein